MDAVRNIYEYIVQPNSLGNLLSNFNNLNSGVLILNVNPLIGEVVVGAVLVFFVYLFSDFIYSYLLLSILPLSNCANLEGKATRSRPIKISPYFITGFFDAESYFTVSIRRSSKMNTGWLVVIIFGINLHIKDRALLEQIKSFFGVGKVTDRGKDAVQYRVSSIKELVAIVEHFDKFPLISKKWADYQLFKWAVEIVKRKDHLTIEGLHKIVSIRATINKGLTEELKVAFPNVIPVIRPVVIDQEIKDPYWISGFVSGEGCFRIDSYKSKTKVGFAVNLHFYITQHLRDTELMQNIVKYFNCGVFKPSLDRDWGNYVVKRFSDITENIIPFFEKYPIEGEKKQDFVDFKQAAEMIKVKSHLTKGGLFKILQLKAGMNKSRFN